MPKFPTQDISLWDEFIRTASRKGRSWIYRSQPRDDPLTTSMERTLRRWGINLRRAPAIEYQSIREFRRRLQGPDYRRVHEDTLYCLALMQHHGAPTRLLDCTYSPFVAAAFAMQDGVFSTQPGAQPTPVIWCFNGDWLEREVTKIVPIDLLEGRRPDVLRCDKTFLPLYKMEPRDLYKRRQSKFVYHENPLHLNERLTIQQGVFLCPGDLGSSFLENLTAMAGWDSRQSMVKLRFKLNRDEAAKFARSLKSMNLGFAALFPGLDGFARSIAQHIVHYGDLAERKIGLSLTRSRKLTRSAN